MAANVSAGPVIYANNIHWYEKPTQTWKFIVWSEDPEDSNCFPPYPHFDVIRMDVPTVLCIDTLRNAHRALKRGGSLYLSFVSPNRDNPALPRAWKTFFNIVSEELARIPVNCVNGNDPELIEALLSSYGTVQPYSRTMTGLGIHQYDTNGVVLPIAVRLAGWTDAAAMELASEMDKEFPEMKLYGYMTYSLKRTLKCCQLFISCRKRP